MTAETGLAIAWGHPAVHGGMAFAAPATKGL
jgi:hypothetical protein